MRLAYRQYAVDPSPLHPSGVLFEPRAPLLMTGSAGSGSYSALLDTGADHCVAPMSEAAALGVDLDGAEQIRSVGFTGDELMLSLGRVEFELNSGGESFR